MHPLVYVLLIAGSALAHYRGYDARNLLENDEPERDIDGIEMVECPVCSQSAISWLAYSEECPIVRAGKTFKKCKYGVYNNPKCGNRRDCYRGPEEQCTEKRTLDHYGQRCAPGYYCNPTVGKCTGLGFAPNSEYIRLINPNFERRSLNYPIRSDNK
ncbi:uncharacterized protein LOC126374844 [Pectinophora gossypiella]|uniref:uncharacterized protein LOC126374844 n=1 Tax=Pectinophora gossypiella TaxID=13191 RepID=UPI00214DF46A|nr:uncharacterized protein LOC126374844 [Pectinophora gossypiella]XP_049877547.1 uncharacterized protein LOC126374844 [Pectinophora gossypiella]